MIVTTGDKIHVVYRAMYENSTRRHFLGEILYAESSVCRIQGYVFVYDLKSTMFVRKEEPRITIIDLAESGYVVNLIDRDVVLNEVEYRYVKDVGLVATDNKEFALNINEFSSKS